MKGILGVICTSVLLVTVGAVQGQNEELTMPEMNPQLYHPNWETKEYDEMSNRNATNVIDQIVYFGDTLSLPFIDDFSRPSLLPYRLDQFQVIEEEHIAMGACLDGHDFDMETENYSLSQSFDYVWNSGTNQVDTIAFDSISITNYDTSASCCFTSNDTLVVWPEHIIKYFNESDGTLDSQKTIPADTVIEVTSITIVRYSPTTLWVDNDAFQNATYPIAPPSIGVATLDGLDNIGMPHNANGGGNYGIADHLTSRPINLNGLSEADEVFLSFFYEPQGLGDYPNEDDSLILQFRDVIGVWHNVWAIPGYVTASAVPDQFEQVMLPIKDQTVSTDPNYYYNGFQFRFRNYASRTGNNDHWHIDYVRLNDNRLNDTLVQDIAIVYDFPSITENFSLMPWKQYQATTDLEDNQTITIVNNDPSSTPSTDFQTIAEETTTATNVYTSTVGTFPANAIVTRDVTPRADYNLPTGQTAKFEVESRFIITPSAANLITTNDTIVKHQVFDNILAYDDGSAERAYGLINNGLKKFAYRYPLHVTDTLAALQIHFTHIDQNVENMLFDLLAWESIVLNDPLAEDNPVRLINNVKAIYIDSINSFATYVFDTALEVSNEFYVGWAQTDTRNIQIGYDLNSTKGRPHMFVFVNGVWSASSVSLDGSPMIRCVLDGDYEDPASIAQITHQPLEVVLFPNPTSDQLFVKFEQEVQSVEYKIYDMMGRLAEAGNLDGKMSIDVKHLVDGPYLLNLTPEGTSQIVVKTFYKN